MSPLFQFPPEAVTCVKADTKPAALAALAAHFSDVFGLDQLKTHEGLLERERLGSTGFGRGLAIPHARLEELRRPVAVLLRLETPCDFDAADGMPVDLVFGLLSPVNAGATHLHALAAISRLVRDDDMHRKMTEAPDSDALYALITNAVDRDAA